MMRVKPYPFQKQGAMQLENWNGRGLIADAPGLGKTLQALLYAHWNPELKPIIVVCPAAAKYVWEAQARDHFQWSSRVLESHKASRRKLIIPRRIVIINYDILHSWVKVLRSLDPQLIILDEAHAIKNLGTLRTKAVYKLCKGISHLICLTATPIEKRPIEFFPILNLLRPDLFPNKYRFGFAYCGARRRPWGIEFKGASRLNELHGILTKHIMIRRHKEDVLEQLPPKIRSVVPLKISNMAEYNEALADFVGWLYKVSPEKAKRAEKAEALVKVGYLLRLVAELKLPAVMRWVDDFLEETDEKLILFGVHKKAIKRLAWKYKQVCVRIDGSVRGKKRHLATQRFISDKKIRLCIANMKAGGVNWSAKGVSHEAFFELAWTPGLHSQAEGRAHGIGRGKKGVGTSIHYLIGKGTVEEKLCKDLQNAQDNISKALDGRFQGKKDFDLFDKLLDSLYLTRSKK